VRKPSIGAVLFAFIPFVAICLSVSLWDRIHPMILGLPFNFFWLIAWLLLTPLCLWGFNDTHRPNSMFPEQLRAPFR
jgi:hypothetical protein